jgi:hypothetical protein
MRREGIHLGEIEAQALAARGVGGTGMQTQPDGVQPSEITTFIDAGAGYVGGVHRSAFEGCDTGARADGSQSRTRQDHPAGCRLAAASPNAAKKAEEEPGSDQAYHREE